MMTKVSKPAPLVFTINPLMPANDKNQLYEVTCLMMCFEGTVNPARLGQLIETLTREYESYHDENGEFCPPTDEHRELPEHARLNRRH